MIAQIRGIVVEKNDRSVVVETGGIGYRIFVATPAASALKEGSEASFFTYLAVREDAMDLFGFLTRDDRALFEHLLTVSGIGPRSAMNILSSSGAEIIRRAIISQDANYLTKVSGIGKKTAEKIVLELKDKIGGITEAESGTTAEGEALDALESLGYPIRDTRDIVRAIARKEKDPGEIVRKALRELGK